MRRKNCNFAGTTFTPVSDFNFRSHTRVFSARVNGLADFRGNGGVGGYLGGGVGYADVKQFNGSKGKFAWQLLAGVCMPVRDNIDVGLKYRYFRASRVSGSHAYVFARGLARATPVVRAISFSRAHLARGLIGERFSL